MIKFQEVNSEMEKHLLKLDIDPTKNYIKKQTDELMGLKIDVNTNNNAAEKIP